MELTNSLSYRKGILISSIYNVVARILQFLFSVIIGYYFGTQAKTDLFFFIFSSITLLAGFINAMDLSVIIPEAMRLKELETEEKSKRFLNFFLLVYLLTGFVITTILFIRPVDFIGFFANFDSIILHENYNLLIYSIPLFLFAIITNFMANVLFSYKHFTIPLIINIINTTLSVLLIITAYQSLNILSIVIGLLFGYTVNLLLLLIAFKRLLKWKFSRFLPFPSKKVLSNLIYSQMGNFVNLLSSYAPLYLLSGLSSGIITAFNYGQRVANLPADFIITQWTNVVGIKFNETYTRRDFEQLNSIFVSISKLLIFILIPISTICFIYADDIIRLLFQRGAFDEQSVQKTALFFQFLVLLSPIFAIVVLTSKLFMAAQKIKESFWYQSIFCLLFIILYYLGVKYFAERGFLYGIIIGYAINLFSIYFLLGRYFPNIKYHKILSYFALILLLNFILFFIFLFLDKILPFGNLLNTIFGIILYLVIIWLLNTIFRINTDVLSLNRIVISKIKSFRA